MSNFGRTLPFQDYQPYNAPPRLSKATGNGIKGSRVFLIRNGANMLRLLKALIIAVVMIVVTVPYSFAAEMSLIYVSAKNCGYCRAYEASLEDQIKAIAKKHHTTYRTVSVESFADISKEQDYPADLKWIAKNADLQNLTPTFLLITGQKIIKRASGTGQLAAYIVPVLQ
jgi:thiol-disulfide isomerase/thioredoxin